MLSIVKYANNGTYKVALTFADKDGDIATQTAAAKVDNVVPAITYGRLRQRQYRETSHNLRR
jgi:23S rRNA maturation-related 3'-5' exoribonuclease YhaM